MTGIDLTAATQAVTEKLDEHNQPWVLGNPTLAYMVHDRSAADARIAVAAAFPLVRDAIADAIDNQAAEPTLVELVYARGMQHTAALVRGLRVTE